MFFLRDYLENICHPQGWDYVHICDQQYNEVWEISYPKHGGFKVKVYLPTDRTYGLEKLAQVGSMINSCMCMWDLLVENVQSCGLTGDYKVGYGDHTGQIGHATNPIVTFILDGGFSLALSGRASETSYTLYPTLLHTNCKEPIWKPFKPFRGNSLSTDFKDILEVIWSSISELKTLLNSLRIMG